MIENPEVLTRQILILPEVLQRKLERGVLKKICEELNLDLAAYHILTLMVLQEQGSMAVTEIGQRLFISRSQMTFCLDRLIILGLIQRQPDPSDRRRIMIDLTLRGRWVIEEISKASDKEILKLLDKLSESEQNQIGMAMEVLERVAAVL